MHVYLMNNKSNKVMSSIITPLHALLHHMTERARTVMREQLGAARHLRGNLSVIAPGACQSHSPRHAEPRARTHARARGDLRCMFIS